MIPFYWLSSICETLWQCSEFFDNLYTLCHQYKKLTYAFLRWQACKKGIQLQRAKLAFIFRVLQTHPYALSWYTVKKAFCCSKHIAEMDKIFRTFYFASFFLMNLVYMICLPLLGEHWYIWGIWKLHREVRIGLWVWNFCNHLWLPLDLSQVHKQFSSQYV